MVIDNHSHVTQPIEKHIQLMDEAGIDRTILFRTLVHPEKYNDAAGIRKEMEQLNIILSGNSSLAAQKSQIASNELFEAIKKYPDRFIGFGAVPIGLNTDELMKFIKYEIISKGFIGIGEFTLASGQIHLLESIFMASNKSGNLPLWIHAFNPLTIQDICEIENLSRKFPAVPIIIGHMGGSNWLETIDIVKRNSNMYLDTSACFSTLALRIVIEELPEKVLYGVDYPYGDMLLTRKTIERVCNDEQVVTKVLGENIQKILKINGR
jgi:predicted TIM-barrel fold metal-dependent hydrolase